MAVRVRHWIVATFAMAVVLLAFVGVVAYRTTRVLVEFKDRVAQSHSLIERLTQLRLLLDDAETGSRGYALTGRREYLEPYTASVAQVDAAIQILRHDLSRDQELLSDFEELQPLIDARLQVMGELVQARDDGGLQAALRIVGSGRGKQLMDKIWSRITALQVREQNLLLEQEREARLSARRAIWTVLLASGLGVVVLTAASSVIYRTVNQREAAEAALRRSEATQRAILDGTNHAVLSLDTNGLIRTVNATGLSWLQYDPAEVIGESVCILHNDDELRARAIELSRSLGMLVRPGFDVVSAKPGRGIPEERQWTYRRKDGTYIPVRASVTALRSRFGEITGYVVVASDLSERLAVERLKDEFISVVSHELRTPLTSIKGALGLLAGGVMRDTPDRASRMLQIASENTDRLMRLVNDILDLERMQSGHLTFEKALVDTAELMQLGVDSVRTLAEASGVRLELQSTSQRVYADSGRIVQSFTNLLGNAIKFSSPGSTVEFGAEVTSTNIIFKVRDHGRGIPREKLETIFERFQQVDASDSRQKGGSGLGLAITRSIVQRHDGEVWAESEPGRGSTFFMRLPLASMSVSAP